MLGQRSYTLRRNLPYHYLLHNLWSISHNWWLLRTRSDNRGQQTSRGESGEGASETNGGEESIRGTGDECMSNVEWSDTPEVGWNVRLTISENFIESSYCTHDTFFSRKSLCFFIAVSLFFFFPQPDFCFICQKTIMWERKRGNNSDPITNSIAGVRARGVASCGGRVCLPLLEERCGH